jgi:hypothetical protein
MMVSNIQQYYINASESLPRSQDEFLHQLWFEKRLRFEGTEGKTDLLDTSSARLFCAALTNRQQLLLVLPDHAPRRMPMLFITGLVMYTLDNLGKSHNHKVIYFGAGASIKDYLSLTYIRNEKLSEIFKQTYLGHTSKSSSSISDNLPCVIFSYSPTSPEDIVNFYQPKWVFIDCGDGEKIEWVRPLILKLAEDKIPSIACVSNQLSYLTEFFEKHNWNIFSWALSSTIYLPTQTKIIPLLIKSQTTFDLAERFQVANQFLVECAKYKTHKLQTDALRAVLRYITGLENLHTPLPFFEAESRCFWRTYSIYALRITAERFVDALELDDFRKILQKVMDEANFIHEQFSKSAPPFWLALQELCIDPPIPTTPTILVFQNRAQKQLFSLAMLAENNIVESDLQKLNVWLINLKQFVQWRLQMEKVERSGEQIEDIPLELRNTYPTWKPILVGVPTKYNYTRYTHLLRFEQFYNLILPHQDHWANWHYRQWINTFGRVIPHNFSTLQRLNPSSIGTPQANKEEGIQEPIIVNPSNSILIEDKVEPPHIRLAKLLQSAPRAEELALLFDTLIPDVDDNPISDLDSEGSVDDASESGNLFVDKALVVRFKEGYEVIFNLSDKIQVVVTSQRGKDLQEKSVRSLKPKDIVLFINGQQRQSLYDLIVSRVNDHPTFTLHISLIEHWQDELVSSFKRSGIPLSDLLAQMQAKGSLLQTETAIRFWLWGLVMCPSDIKDLQRIADILHMPFVQQYYPQIDNAARRLRGIHISLARKLNIWLEQEAFASEKKSFNDVVDAELGLEFRDFQDALMILTVDSLCEECGFFLTSDLGKIKSLK